MDIQDEQDNILSILFIHVSFYILESSDSRWCWYNLYSTTRRRERRTFSMESTNGVENF